MEALISKNNGTKIFVSLSFITGSSIVLFSLIGHFLTPTKLIPSSFIGGTFGIVLATLFCFKQKYIDRTNLLPVTKYSNVSIKKVYFVAGMVLSFPAF
jgi:hypothetical protein